MDVQSSEARALPSARRRRELKKRAVCGPTVTSSSSSTAPGPDPDPNPNPESDPEPERESFILHPLAVQTLNQALGSPGSTMLQQILADMYVDPELLAELNEEQKQTLFFKMREEQVRRWREREAELEKEEAVVQKPKKKATGKHVSWLQASDSNVWVWVMGEHPSDKPYEEICDKIIAERAALQAQKEAEELRAKKEQEILKRFSSVYLSKEEQLRKEEEAARQEEQRRHEEELKRREEEERQKAEEEVQRLEQERAKQIYINLKEIHRRSQNQEKEDPEWQETLRRSKEEDRRRSFLAKQAREDHRRKSVKALEQGRVALLTKAFGRERPALLPKPKPRTTKNEGLSRRQGVRRTQSSSSREQIIRWFKEEQVPLRAGFQKDDSGIAPWFHGIITRQDAEALLGPGEPGHFLVRVSEKIAGYVLSYRSQDGFKHFLIDATDNCFMLLGDQLTFASLAELVEYHEKEPITPSGGEQLLHPCEQKPGSVDYVDLFT
ncbi:SH2 domain-containing protein 4A [Arapaima gigas]